MILRNMMTAGKWDAILDLYPNPQCAYSTRPIRGSGTWGIMQIRRSSDDATTFLFTNDRGEYDNYQDVLNFVGNNEGTVATLYDMGNNNYHLTAPTIANEPVVIRNGAFVEVNGNIAIDFTTSNKFLRNENFNMNTNPHTVFSVVDFSNLDTNLRRFLSMQRDVSSQGNWIYGGTTTSTIGGSRLPINNQAVSSVVGNGQDTLYYMTNSSNYQEISVGDNQVDINTGSVTHTTMEQIRFGQANNDTGTSLWQGHIQEIIIYPTDRSSDREGIQDNQRNYFGL